MNVAADADQQVAAAARDGRGQVELVGAGRGEFGVAARQAADFERLGPVDVGGHHGFGRGGAEDLVAREAGQLGLDLRVRAAVGDVADELDHQRVGVEPVDRGRRGDQRANDDHAPGPNVAGDNRRAGRRAHVLGLQVVEIAAALKQGG